MWIPKPLCKRLQPEETGQQKSTNSLPNSTKKRLKPRQYDIAPQEAQATQDNGITACISLEGDLLSYVPLKFSTNQQRKAFIDTGACANAISEKDYQELKPFGTPLPPPSEVNKVKLASGQLIPVRGQIELTFSIAKHPFKEKFLVLPNTKWYYTGKSVLQNNSIELYPKENLMKLPDIALQLNEIQPNPKEKQTKPQYTVRTLEKITIASNQQTTLKCGLISKRIFTDVCGIVEPKLSFEDKTGLCITSSLSRTDPNGYLYLSALNLQNNEITIPGNSDIAFFKFLSPQQAETLTPIDPQLLMLAKSVNPDDFVKEINQLIIDEEFNSDSQPPRPKREYKKFWFPTPETCKHPERLKGVEKRIYDELSKLQELDQIDPQTNQSYRKKFLQRFEWKDSVLIEAQKQQVEELFVEFSDIFAKHRFDVGYNSEITMKLTPEHDQPVYTQSPTTPIHLREELQVELALLQYFGIITSLNHSKYSSPIFAHRKTNGELRILVNLRRINHLLLHDYHNNNFPISTMADTTAHSAGKSLFCKVDCSQAYHCVQMADPLSVQLLAFNFASRTMAYQRLARRLNRAVTGFSAFVRNYLEPCLSANICTQFMDDVGCGIDSPEQLLPYLRQIFQRLRRSGLKLSPEKCIFGSEQVDFLGNVTTKEGIKPEKEKIEKFLRTLEVPKSVKQVKRLIGILQFFRNFIPNLNEHLMPFYKLLRKNVSFELTEEILNAFDTLKEKLQTTTTQTLGLAKPGLQYAILCDASYHSSGFMLMTEDYVKNEQGESVKSYAPVSFGSKVFNTAQLKMSIYCKEFLSLYFALETSSHFICGSDKPVLILTDNKSLTRFFQAKTIPPSLWNYVDRVTAFNIVVAHIPGKANATADFLSRLQSDPNEIIELTLTDRIPIREIEIDVRAKLPDNTINELFADDFPDELLQVVEINTLITLKQPGNYEQTSRLKGITEHGADM